MSAAVVHRVTVKKHPCGRTWTATCSACPWEWPSAWWWKSLLWATRHADEHRANDLSMSTKNHPAAASYGGMQRPGWVGTNPPTTASEHPAWGRRRCSAPAGRVTPRTSAGREAT